MLRRIEPPDCTITWEGREMPARAGESLAVALLAAGELVFRETPVSGAARGPLCLMGACFDCLVVADGVENTQACMLPVRPGLVAARQRGARGLPLDNAA
jgi:D-hydroxyproline dehydrogenase subunit gamma